MMKTYTVAVAGAMGAVGTEMLKNLESRNFPVGRIKPLDVGDNVGKELLFRGEAVKVEQSCPEAFAGVDIALFAVGAGVSRTLAPAAVERGAVVIDNSSQWRMTEGVPLVVPEVNPQDLRTHKGIIAILFSATTTTVVSTLPLHDAVTVKRIIASTYQAVSGAGAPGLAELREQTGQILRGEPISPQVFPHQIAFNVIPHIDVFEDNGYTFEEMKMLNEGRKILGCPDLRVNCTCVRVPVFRSHSESITIETEKPITPDQARSILSGAPGVKVVDDPAKLEYPMPADTSNQDLVYVGRIRRDISTDANALTFWCCGDQVRKGAAVNAIQIAEKMIEMQLI